MGFGSNPAMVQGESNRMRSILGQNAQGAALPQGNPAQAPQVSNPMANPFTQASAAQQAALGRTAMGMGQTAAMGMGAYQNPYENQVVQAAMQDVGQQAAMGLNQLRSNATQAGAFGGARHGIAEAEAMKGYQQQAMNTAAQMRQQGFNTALGASQSDLARQLGSAGQLAGLGQQSFGYGQNIQQQQLQQGGMQQQAMQAIIDAARAQYGGYTQAPMNKLNLPLAALGQAPVPQTQVNSKQPGLFDYLTMAATAGAGMA
jgi:hypothetical protein